MLTECQPQRRRRLGRSVRSRPAVCVCATEITSCVVVLRLSKTNPSWWWPDVQQTIEVRSSVDREVMCAVGHGDRDRGVNGILTTVTDSLTIPIAAPICFRRHHLRHLDHCSLHPLECSSTAHLIRRTPSCQVQPLKLTLALSGLQRGTRFHFYRLLRWLAIGSLPSLFLFSPLSRLFQFPLLALCSGAPWWSWLLELSLLVFQRFFLLKP
jgi:hypothetical protein